MIPKCSKKDEERNENRKCQVEYVLMAMIISIRKSLALLIEGLELKDLNISFKQTNVG